MKSIIAFATATIISGSAAFAADTATEKPAQRPAVGNQQPADAQPAGAREPGEASAKSENADQMFIKNAISDNLLEVQLGQIAQDKATDDQVKQFAAMVVKDHTQALMKLRQLAKSSDSDSQNELSPVHQAKLKEMQKKSGEEFTRCYAIGQYGHHVMDVLEFSYQAQNAKDPAVKQFASEMVPKLREHQEQAQQIAMSQSGAGNADTARPAGARIPRTGGGNDADKTGTSDNAAKPGRTGTSDRPEIRDNVGNETPSSNGRAQ